MKELNWHDFTDRVRQQFDFIGCFFFNHKLGLWVGDEPSGAFRQFLHQLFQAKDESYFRQTHFFKLREGNDTIINYLALIPLRIHQLQFEFLGVIYTNPDQLMELLKKKILTRYLVNLIKERLDQHQFRLMREQETHELLQALEEKAFYADQLEEKVTRLRDEIDRIKAGKGNNDQKLQDLNRILEQQSEEYEELAVAYQDLFNTYQNLEREFVKSTVDFENRITDLKSLNEQLSFQLGEAQAVKSAPNLEKEIRSLRSQMSALRKEAETYKQQVDTMRKAGGSISPELISQLREQIAQERKKSEAYRLRMVQMEMQSKYNRKKENCE